MAGPERELFVNQVRLLRIEGRTFVPTALYYSGKQVLFGVQAVEECTSPEYLIEDFKVDLGKDDPANQAKKRTSVGEEVRRSSIGLAQDFIRGTLQEVERQLTIQGLNRPTRILVAEPLSLGGDGKTSEAWLSNYRASIRRIIPSHFAEVDFMPEPFAVFQYYRYGIRHPFVAQKIKHVALVLDFGGGTFDASVIETVASGDISQSGRNSRPLAALSIPVGGFYVNERIAEKLIFDSTKGRIRPPSAKR